MEIVITEFVPPIAVVLEIITTPIVVEAPFALTWITAPG